MHFNPRAYIVSVLLAYFSISIECNEIKNMQVNVAIMYDYIYFVHALHSAA